MPVGVDTYDSCCFSSLCFLLKVMLTAYVVYESLGSENANPNAPRQNRNCQKQCLHWNYLTTFRVGRVIGRSEAILPGHSCPVPVRVDIGLPSISLTGT